MKSLVWVPDYKFLKSYKPPVSSKVYSGDGELVKDFVEKPKEFISNWASIGCYEFTPEIFEACEKVEKSERGEYELTDAIKALAKQGKVKSRKMLDYWLDFGNPDDIEKVANFLEAENK